MFGTLISTAASFFIKEVAPAVSPIVNAVDVLKVADFVTDKITGEPKRSEYAPINPDPDIRTPDQY